MNGTHITSLTSAGVASHPQLQLIHRDLEAAREIQSLLLPGRMPHLQGLDYHGECRPAGQIGGDFFDFLPLPGNQLSMSLGDVSGHGIGAAILMSGLQAFLRGLTAGGCGEIAGVVAQLNQAVHRISPDNFYATLFYAHLDPIRRQMHYVSAGHEAALLVRKRTGQVMRLESTGTVLGLTTRSMYGKRTVSLEPGDVLLAYTDGLTDAVDAQGREWGEVGIRQVLHRCPDLRAPHLVSAILEAVDRFTGGAAATDDQTVAAVRFTGTADRIIVEEDAELAIAAA